MSKGIITSVPDLNVAVIVIAETSAINSGYNCVIRQTCHNVVSRFRKLLIVHFNVAILSITSTILDLFGIRRFQVHKLVVYAIHVSW